MADLTDKAYWDRAWEQTPLPPPMRLERNVGRHPARKLDAIFRTAFHDLPVGSHLIELGCAQSVWLPHFAHAYGFRVTGVDYSELGCSRARELLERESVDGRVVCGDFRTPPPDLLATADALVSFGLFEHFVDTVDALRAARQLLRPGGVIVTEIPNLVGAVGLVQRHVNRPVFDAHVPLSREALADVHQRAGFEIVTCDYAVSLVPGIVNTAGMPPGWRRSVTKVLLRVASRLAMPLWVYDEHVRALPATAFLAGYVVCVARALN